MIKLISLLIVLLLIAAGAAQASDADYHYQCAKIKHNGVKIYMVAGYADKAAHKIKAQVMFEACVDKNGALTLFRATDLENRVMFIFPAYSISLIRIKGAK